MDELTIWLQHSGKWTENHKYVDFQVDGILVKSSCNFEKLLAEIAKQLGKLDCKHLIQIMYSVKEGSPPLKIQNDMSVKLYTKLKERHPDMEHFPLCISFTENTVITPLITTLDDTENQAFIPLLIEDEINRNIMHHEDEFMEENEQIIYKDDEQKLEIGQVFGDKTTLSSLMKKYAVTKSFQWRVVKSCKRRYYLGCIDEKCTWRLRASNIKGTILFKVTKFNDNHTCSNVDRFYENRQATSRVIANIIKEKLVDPKTLYVPNDIVRDLRLDHGVTISYMKAWRAKEQAMELLLGLPKESYKKLTSYLYMVKNTNPGSFTDLKEENGCFLYAFIALYPSKKGWMYCRPTVVVDGSFMKSTHRGTLLIACTLDPAGQILPLAYAAVDSENDKSWLWFFEKFKEAYGERHGMSIISDRHESIMKAAATVYSQVPHCVCMFHLWNNIKTNFKKSQKRIQPIFFPMARAFTIEEFNKHMGTVEGIDTRVKEYLENIGYYKWARAHCKNIRTMTMTSNIAESMNAANKYARDLPIMKLFEFMTSLVQQWNYNNKKNANGIFTHLTTKYENILRKRFQRAQKMRVVPSNDYLHTVFCKDRRYIVNLREKTCTCRRFQLVEIPCSHALAIIKRFGHDAYKYCSEYYTTQNVKSTYDIPVYPLPDESNWDIPAEVLERIIQPPEGTSKPGRPNKRRYKSSWEKHHPRAEITCTKCGQMAHNRRTCRNIAK